MIGRTVTTNIDLDEGTCSLDLVQSAAGFFSLGLPDARTIIKEVGTAVAKWRAVATEVGARPAKINRMASAFEHENLTQALAL